jgi:hypothetical protein
MGRGIKNVQTSFMEALSKMILNQFLSLQVSDDIQDVALRLFRGDNFAHDETKPVHTLEESRGEFSYQ